MKIVPNALTRLQDVEKGSAQFAIVDYSLGPQLVGAPGIYVPNLGYQPSIRPYMGMNMEKFPTNNLLFREAVAHR